ncbi:DUF6660 family protein [Mucilaginibacter mali]|uniref:DUF6660 family protein n=1 Tax=Mucilaginibacter mali TaxID=2740462 RepID=UPI00374474D6
MKLLTSIWGLYICLLSVLPCHDGEHNPALNQVTSITNHTNDNGQLSDICSPFCICSCCSSVRNISSPVIIKIRPLFKSQIKYQAYKAPSLLTSNSDIWQPPQLS